MSSRYAAIANEYDTIVVRKWGGDYYWMPYGKTWVKMTMPPDMIEANIVAYKSEWFDTEGEAMEHARYRQKLLKIETLMDAAPNSPEAEQLSLLADEVIAYEDIHYPIKESEPCDE